MFIYVSCEGCLVKDYISTSSLHYLQAGKQTIKIKFDINLTKEFSEYLKRVKSFGKNTCKISQKGNDSFTQNCKKSSVFPLFCIAQNCAMIAF